MWTSITPTYWKDVDRRSSSSFLLCECVFSPFWRFGPQSKDEDWVSWTCVLTPSFCCGEITQPCLHLYLSNLQVTRPFFSLRQLVFHVSINWCPNVSCSFHLCWVNYDYEWMRYGRLYTSDNNTAVMLRLSREDNLVELLLPFQKECAHWRKIATFHLMSQKAFGRAVCTARARPEAETQNLCKSFLNTKVMLRLSGEYNMANIFSFPRGVSPRHACRCVFKGG